jgi:YesN/AraC family two-component response regulator
MNYCNSHSDEDLSLRVLERELHLNKYYISHVMNSKLHIGLNDYVNSLRVSNACKWLVKSNRTITEISDEVGFNTLRTFNRAFVKQTGMTPSEYRRSKKGIV